MAHRLSSFIRTSALLLGFTALTSPAFAVEINQEGAAELKAMFTRMLEFQKDAAAVNQNPIHLEGEVQVEPAEGYYAVTLPHMSVREPGGAGMFDIGIVALNATPTDDEKLWKVSLAIPTPMTAYDEQGNPVFVVDIGRQRMAGVWHETLENFVTLDASYENITMSSAPENFRMTMPQTTIVYDLKQGENQQWSGPFTLDVNGITVLAEGQEALSVRKVRVASEIFDLNPQALALYREKIAALAENINEGGETAQQAPSSEHAMAIYNTLFEFFTSAWGGFTSNVSVEGLSIASKATDTAPAQRISLGSAAYGFDMLGFNDDKITVAVRAGFEDFAAVPPPADTQGLVPDDFKLDLRINDLPFRKIAELGKSTLETSLQSPEMAQMSGMQAMMTLPALLTEAGTHIRLEDFVLTGEQYAADFEGRINADMNAQYGATAEAKGALAGLETIINLLSARMNDAKTTPEEKQKLQSTLQGLAFFQMLGREATGEDGKPVRTYDFKLGPDGKMLLNGGDLGALMGQPVPGSTTQSAPADGAPSAQ